MSALALKLYGRRDRLGLKGPRAAQWLAAQGVAVPTTPNTWMQPTGTGAAEELLAARLGTAEFFLEEGLTGTTLKRIAPSLDGHPPGVYPVLREDSAFILSGEQVHDVLAQVCNVNFAALSLDTRPLIMTLMIGVAVLVVPQNGPGEPGAAAERRDAGERQYRIWCDPSFGRYLGESLGAVVIECGGRTTGVSG